VDVTPTSSQALDVLEHVDDDLGSFRALAQLLRPGGHLFVTVPAYPSLWSRHDDLHHHKRRYDKARLQEAAVRCYAQDAMDEIEASARKLLAAVEEGDTLRTLLAAVKRFTKREAAITVALRRQVADAAVEQVGYPLG